MPSNAQPVLFLAPTDGISLSMASNDQPVLSLGPSEPIALSMLDDNPAQLSLATGGSAGAVISVNQKTGAVLILAPLVVTLIDQPTLQINAALGGHFRVTLGGNRTVAAPSNPTDGQRITFEVIQDGAGSRTLTWAGGAFDFGTAGQPVLSTVPGDRDFIGLIYNAATALWYIVAYAPGY